MLDKKHYIKFSVPLLSTKEAEIVAEKTIKQVNVQLINFCPAINDFCREDCQCFIKPVIERKVSNETSEVLYYISESYCNNALLNMTDFLNNLPNL